MKKTMPPRPDIVETADTDAAALLSWLREHLPDGSVSAVGTVGDRTALLAPEEFPVIEHAVSRRRNEFSSGRALARSALGQFGLGGAAIPVGAGRQPVWPTGLRGSISHCGAICAVVVASSSSVAAIGLDVERISDVDDQITRQIASPEEILQNRDKVAPHALGACLFSIREAVFKAYFPETGVFLEYLDLVLSLDIERGVFAARLSNPYRPALLGHRVVRGKFGMVRGYVISVASVLLEEVSLSG